MNPEDVAPGDELYIDTSLYIDHGEDDVCGGIAIVENVVCKPIPENPVNSYFAYFVGIPRGRNLTIILESQERWKVEYGNRLAHACPDVPGHICPDPRRKLALSRDEMIEAAGRVVEAPPVRYVRLPIKLGARRK